MEVWRQLGSLPPTQLIQARLELHHALQLVSIGVAKTLVPSREDDSHTALAWLDVAKQWVSEEIPKTGGMRAGLQPSGLYLTVGGKDDPAGQQLDLDGRTRGEGLAWLRQRLSAVGVDPDDVILDFHYDMPEHPIDSEGEYFDGDLEDARVELARYFAGASVLLGEVCMDAAAVGLEKTSPILTWPHHFDIATVATVAAAQDSHQMGIGLSPGDGTYDQPYFYVQPWSEIGDERPTLDVGHWQGDDFKGAVLTGDELIALEDPAQGARHFLRQAIEHCRRLMAG